MKISVVIPTLNEESIILEIVNRVIISLIDISTDYEIIFIDDGSRDLTWSKIVESGVKNPRVKGIKLSKNWGQHIAISSGLKFSTGEWVVVMDGDLQDRPELIPELYYKALEGYDSVFVSRFGRHETFTYRIFQKIFYFIVNILSGLKLDSDQANFSINHRNVVNSYNNLSEQSRFFSISSKWLGFKRGKIKGEQGIRFDGISSYTLRSRIKLATDVILSFSDRPLKVGILIGILMSITAFVYSLRILFLYYFSSQNISAWASLMITVLLSSGIILIVLGIVGTYIGKIYNEVKKRPLFVVEKYLNLDEKF